MVISKRKVVTRTGAALTAAALLVPLMSAIAAGPASATRAPSITSFPRSETLYTSGTAYSPPSNWNPYDSGSRYTGTIGLLYETLFLYDPIHNKYIPWLATSGSWSGDHLHAPGPQQRQMEQWLAAYGQRCRLLHQPGKDQPGCPLQQHRPVPLGEGRRSQRQYCHRPLHQPGPVHRLAELPLEPARPPPVRVVEAVGYGPGHRGQHDPRVHRADDTGTRWIQPDRGLLPGQPPLVGHRRSSGCRSTSSTCATSVNGSNNVELSALLSNNIDWSNNFLPGINTLMTIGGNNFLQTYYPAPYMLSANTAWLELNTSKAPMNNVNFRKAVAYAINPRHRERRLHRHRAGGQPGRAAAQPRQLHQPERRQAVRLQLQPGAGQAVPQGSGYKGQKLTLEVPDGWTDWMAAIQNISQELNAHRHQGQPHLPVGQCPHL